MLPKKRKGRKICCVRLIFRTKSLKKKLKGYDVEQVDDFLDKLIKENQTMKDRLTVLTETLEHYKSIEATMNNAVDTARETASGITNNAKAEAENIIARAKLDAQKLSKQIDDEHAKKHREMLKLKEEIEVQKSRIASICNSIMKLAGDL